MSTKIYNGFQLHTGNSLKTIQDFGCKVRETLLPKLDDIEERAMAIYGDDGIHKRLLEIKTRGLANNLIDIDIETDLTFFPYDHSLLLVVLTVQEPFLDAIEALPEVEEYGYWDNADRPDNVSELEWDMRENKWSEVLGKSYTPNVNGLTFKVFDLYDIRKDIRDYKYGKKQ